MSDIKDKELLEIKKLRWRMILGSDMQDCINSSALTKEMLERDAALEFLYGREYGSERNMRNSQKDKSGSLDDSILAVPEWINKVHELFPQKVIERLEKDALERYGMDEMVTNPELLKNAKPSVILLKAVLQTKHLMNKEVLELARDLARKVIRELMEKFKQEIEVSFSGSINKRQRSMVKNARNFDAKLTIKLNLKNYSKDLNKIIIQNPYFFSRKRNYAKKWQMIILVDESGSMMENVIYSAVCASIFNGLPSLKTHLIIFDTNVVDLTGSCDDPMETLMKVQLGGGTDITKAVNYGMQLIENPDRCFFIIISDFYEGNSEENLVRNVKGLVDSSVSVLGLAALDSMSRPVYNHHLAQRLVNAGAHIGAMSPGELASWVSEKMSL